MKTDSVTVLVSVNSHAEEPTPASIWHALAGSSVTEDILEWPADLFALTNVILKRTEAYRFVFSPPGGEEWPPRRLPSWIGRVHSQSFWSTNGSFSASGPRHRWKTWQRGATGECVRRC